jgi:hypothetical protein
MAPGSFTAAQRKHSAIQSYYTVKQSRTESLGDFSSKLDSFLASMTQSGVEQAEIPSAAAQAVPYAHALDQSRFRQFVVDYKNNILEY